MPGKCRAGGGVRVLVRAGGTLGRVRSMGSAQLRRQPTAARWSVPYSRAEFFFFTVSYVSIVRDWLSLVPGLESESVLDVVARRSPGSSNGHRAARTHGATPLQRASPPHCLVPSPFLPAAEHVCSSNTSYP